MNEALRSLIDVDRIIHEPARLMIVAILSAVAEADFLYLLQASGLTKGNLSSHLSRLEKAGYVQIGRPLSARPPYPLSLNQDRAGRSCRLPAPEESGHLTRTMKPCQPINPLAWYRV